MNSIVIALDPWKPFWHSSTFAQTTILGPTTRRQPAWNAPFQAPRVSWSGTVESQGRCRTNNSETNCNGDLDFTISRRNFRPSCEHVGDVREKHWRNSTRMFNVSWQWLTLAKARRRASRSRRTTSLTVSTTENSLGSAKHVTLKVSSNTQSVWKRRPTKRRSTIT